LGREFLEDLRIDVPFHVSDRKQKAHLRSWRDVSSHNQTSAPPQMQKSRREGRQPPRLARSGACPSFTALSSPTCVYMEVISSRACSRNFRTCRLPSTCKREARLRCGATTRLRGWIKCQHR
jgi:hypothetical protein